MDGQFSLQRHGITVREVFRNMSPSGLYEEAIRHEPGTSISDTGCLIAYSGEKTGRSGAEVFQKYLELMKKHAGYFFSGRWPAKGGCGFR